MFNCLSLCILNAQHKNVQEKLQLRRQYIKWFRHHQSHPDNCELTFNSSVSILVFYTTGAPSLTWVSPGLTPQGSVLTVLHLLVLPSPLNECQRLVCNILNKPHIFCQHYVSYINLVSFIFILYWNCFKGNIREASERSGGAHKSFSKHVDTTLS